MIGKVTTMKRAEFKRPDGVLIAGMGILIIVAACAAVIMAVSVTESFDLATIALIVLGFSGACALGIGLINTWRTPMLTVRPDVLTVPTFFVEREIPIKAGHPLGEYLASSIRNRRRLGTIEGNKFVHFYTLDSVGVLTELMCLHREAPEIAPVRRAFKDIAGLTIETLKVDPNSKPSGPDVEHWKNL